MPADPGRLTLRHQLHTDGAARGNPGPAGIGVILSSPDGQVVLEEISDGIGWATNNVAEYEALIQGLESAHRHGIDEVDVFCDSVLVVEQLKGAYRVKHKGLKPLHAKARELADRFARITFKQVPRERNARADELANRGIDDWLEANPGFVPPKQPQQELF